MANQSRRGFLAYLGLAGATAAVTTAATVTVAAKASDGHFKHPADYLAAMLAIGIRPTAVFQRLSDGSIVSLGVSDPIIPSPEWVAKHWREFHAISMRMPVRMAHDRPQGEWWSSVWQYLYDKGLRECASPPDLVQEI